MREGLVWSPWPCGLQVLENNWIFSNFKNAQVPSTFPSPFKTEMVKRLNYWKLNNDMNRYSTKYQFCSREKYLSFFTRFKSQCYKLTQNLKVFSLSPVSSYRPHSWLLLYFRRPIRVCISFQWTLTPASRSESGHLSADQSNSIENETKKGEL